MTTLQDQFLMIVLLAAALIFFVSVHQLMLISSNSQNQYPNNSLLRVDGSKGLLAIGGHLPTTSSQHETDYVFDPIPGDNRPPFVTLLDAKEDDYNNNHHDDNNHYHHHHHHRNMSRTQTRPLLHFAMIGFGKCGTTTMLNWLESHPQLQTFPKEVHDLSHGRLQRFVQKIYSMPHGHYWRGYKCPTDAGSPTALRLLAEFFPDTKLIVALRHPVRWFESLYNFRIQNLDPHKNHHAFPRPDALIGTCNRAKKNTCTAKGEFAVYLRQWGKTTVDDHPLYDALERRMLDASGLLKHTATLAVPNPLYIYELDQLKETPEQVRQDLSAFLALNRSGDPLLPPLQLHAIPGRTWEDHLQALKDSVKIDICEYPRVRRELMRMARVNSVWLRQSFLWTTTNATTNNTNNRGGNVHWTAGLEQVLQGWMYDPCRDRRHETQDAGKEVLGEYYWNMPGVW